MSNIEKFLLAAFPHVDPTTVKLASAELAGTQPPRDSSELEELEELITALRRDNGKLNDEIIRHKDGVQHATRAGLDVLGERARQRRLEGYDDSHDDGHDDFELTSAAIAYAMDARLRGTSGGGYDTPPADWPWSRPDWKPKDVRRSLVVSAALLIAEIEKFDRATGR